MNIQNTIIIDSYGNNSSEGKKKNKKLFLKPVLFTGFILISV